MKKILLAVILLVVVGAAGAADAPAPPASAPLKGRVLEVKDVGNYTYLRLKTKDGETWAAVNKSTVKKGADVTVENAMVMKNFESKTLKKTFDTIVFGTLGGAAPGEMAAAHAGIAKPPADIGDVKVPKAEGPNARTVAEVAADKGDLKDKTVVVRGKVVKFTAEVMGKNWIHLRDGSGSAADNTNDVLVTTKDKARIGDVVVVKGVVHNDRDFGSGYAYKVLIEDATLQK
jgi:hypothetical protein